jgi:AcrR family transcriptional regulator
LDDAILAAALEELSEAGYARLTIERVAERARTGKASVYRRWPTRLELVMDAVYSGSSELQSPPDTGTLRGDLLALLRAAARMMAGPAGEAMRGLIIDVASDPERMTRMRQHSQGASVRAMREITRRAVERGEIVAEAVTPRRLEVGQAMLRQRFLFYGAPIPDRTVLEIVDEILLPLLHS